MPRSSCGKATSALTVGNTALNWTPRKWSSGGWTCEARHEYKTCAHSRGAPRARAAAYRRGTTPRPACPPAYARAGAHRQKARAHEGLYAYGQRYRRDDHTSRGFCPGHQVHSRKCKDAAARGGERCPFAADESGRLTRSYRVPDPRAPILEYHLPSKHQLTPRVALGPGLQAGVSHDYSGVACRSM